MINFQQTKRTGSNPKTLADHFQHPGYSGKSVTQMQNENMLYRREIPYDFEIEYELGMEMRSDRIPFNELSDASKTLIRNHIRDSSKIFESLTLLVSEGFKDLVFKDVDKDGLPGKTGIIGYKFRLKLGIRQN